MQTVRDYYSMKTELVDSKRCVCCEAETKLIIKKPRHRERRPEHPGDARQNLASSSLDSSTKGPAALQSS